MSIPFDFDPMGVPATGEAPVVYTDNNIDFDKYPEPSSSGRIPIPYLLDYEININHRFFREGTIQLTHIITVVDVQNPDTYIGVIGRTGVPTDNPTRKDFLCLTDAPVGEVASKKLVEMRLNIHNQPLPCATWGSSTGWLNSGKPPVTKKSMTSEWRSNGVNEAGEETFTWVRAISTNYMHPLLLPRKTEDVTDCPDGTHVGLRAQRYPNVPVAYGFRYIFSPNSTV